MSKIVIIIGLPGSGKTTYIKNNFDLNRVLICDDYYKNSSNLQGSKFTRSNYYHELVKALGQDKEIVISDIVYCKKERLNEAVDFLKNLSSDLNVKINFDFIYFENNPDACKKNILNRKRKNRVDKELSFVDEISFGYKYNIPKDARIIPVFKG